MDDHDINLTDRGATGSGNDSGPRGKIRQWNTGTGQSRRKYWDRLTISGMNASNLQANHRTIALAKWHHR
jgi:hypothetical protein